MPLLTASRPKVLVPEKLSPDGLALLRSSLDVHERKGLSADELLQIIPDYDALLVRSETKVTATVLQAAKNLKVVARAGVGVDNVGKFGSYGSLGCAIDSCIDVAEATKLGIVVVNSPSGNIGAAAEHTIALMMAMARKVPESCASLKDGKWERSKFVGVEVKGKTLSIIGLGKGKRFLNRLVWEHGLTVQRTSGIDSSTTGQGFGNECECPRSICISGGCGVGFGRPCLFTPGAALIG